MAPEDDDRHITVTPPKKAVAIVRADDLLSLAIEKGASIDTIERLVALRKEIKAEEAKEAFNAAMANFQAECPVIRKTKPVRTKSGQVAYRFAPIDSIVAQVKHLIEKHGFRYTTTIEFEGNLVKALCRVVHTLGHEELSVMPVPLGAKTDIMSPSQVVAAAATFAKRYAFLNAFGIMTGDEDTDAAPPPTAPGAPVRPAPYSVPRVPEAQLPPAKIRPDQSRKLFATWGEYLRLSGKTTEQGKVLRKALMQEMFQVDTSVKLTERQAEALQRKIEELIRECVRSSLAS